ncbi:hypothetical protein EJ02DRAFT_139085 [Clathrospora elynae]|uniref:Uncharacterized protein n=1 Tax=Clathrospora elynae TaxID=706981 RepID=A0A6A5T515_9PLEO|nr:hypothetical protein EJ02DRAFT_139085 [Clathrospora elynae]
MSHLPTWRVIPSVNSSANVVLGCAILPLRVVRLSQCSGLARFGSAGQTFLASGMVLSRHPESYESILRNRYCPSNRMPFPVLWFIRSFVVRVQILAESYELAPRVSFCLVRD